MSETDIGFGFKVVFAGNSGVGKTAAIQKFCFDKFPENHKKTLVSQFHEYSYDLNDRTDAIDLMLWDTPGRESLSLLAEDAFANSNIAVIFYAINDRASFEGVPMWVEKVKAITAEAQIVLVENKVDLIQSSEITSDEAQRMADQLDAPLFRVSVLEGLNVSQLFSYLAVTLQNRFLSLLNSLPRGSDAFFMGADDHSASNSQTASPRPTTYAQESGYCNVA